MPKNVTFDKEEILKSLIPVFIRKGYNGTSMQDIVEATGLNRSSIYNSFGDKQALYMAVLNHYSEKQLPMKEHILALDTNTRSALRKFFEELFIARDLSAPNEGCLLTNCSLEMGKSDMKIKGVVLSGKKSMIENFRKIIELGQERKEISSDIDADAYASFLYNNLQGLRVLNSSSQDIHSSTLIIEQLFRAL